MKIKDDNRGGLRRSTTKTPPIPIIAPLPAYTGQDRLEQNRIVQNYVLGACLAAMMFLDSGGRLSMEQIREAIVPLRGLFRILDVLDLGSAKPGEVVQ